MTNKDIDFNNLTEEDKIQLQALIDADRKAVNLTDSGGWSMADWDTIGQDEIEAFQKWKDMSRLLDDPISEIIRGRIATAGGKYFSNDNISDYIEEGELEFLQAEVESKLVEVLKSLVIDTDNDHNTKDTAKRVAKMFVNETFGGRYKPKPKVTAFPNITNYDGIYCTGPISIRSTCAHHLQNIVGKCYIGVKPGKEVIGLSKFNRIAHWIAERPQIQEEMTLQIADELQKAVGTDNIAIVIKAEHHCMTHRGVKEHESDMTTAIMRGEFQNIHAIRDEFYRIIDNMK